MCERRVVPSF
ncbi:hypothetical protein YPPY99_1080, partial [Yersinia pestis PY-99]